MFIIIATGGAGVCIIIPAIFTFLVFSFAVEINQTLKLEVIIPPHQGIILGTRLSYKHPHSKEGRKEARKHHPGNKLLYTHIHCVSRKNNNATERKQQKKHINQDSRL